MVVRSTNQHPRQRLDHRSLVFILLGGLAVFGWIYIFFMSDLFLINDIEVTGLKSLDQTDVSREVYTLLDQDPKISQIPWLGRHTFFLNRAELEEGLRERLFAENVTVDKAYLNILRLTVEERSNKVIIHSNQQLFWADLQGVINAELSQDERKQVQDRLNGKRQTRPQEPNIISIKTDEPLSTGYKVTDTMTLKSWITLSQKLLKAGVPLIELEPSIDGNSQDVLNCQGDIQVDIDTQGNLETQINAFLKLKRLQSDLLKPGILVDVRVPGRIYLR